MRQIDGWVTLTAAGPRRGTGRLRVGQLPPRYSTTPLQGHIAPPGLAAPWMSSAESAVLS
jgi:hypothetical protein